MLEVVRWENEVFSCPELEPIVVVEGLKRKYEDSIKENLTGCVELESEASVDYFSVSNLSTSSSSISIMEKSDEGVDLQA
jgi:hypothetical protein